MPDAVANAIAYVGAAVGLIGGGVGLYNAKKAVLWKRAELANSYLRELGSNETLVFACRALDWNGGLLIVSNVLGPLITGDKRVIKHDLDILKLSVVPGLLLDDMSGDERLQLYRTAIDGLLSWLALIASGLQRNLFVPQDVEEVGYWVFRIKQCGFLEDFIEEFGYAKSTRTLRQSFSYKIRPIRSSKTAYLTKNAISRGGFGTAGKGRSAGG